MTTDDPTIPARDELVALALATRRDWHDADVHAAITHAANTGMTWRRVMVELVRLAADPTGEPRDLVIDHRDPARRQHAPAPPTEEYRRVRAGLVTTGELPAITSGETEP